MEHIKLDEKDHQIIGLLQEDSAQSTRKIAKKLNIPITTVHSRIKRLKELGIIRKFTIDVNYPKMGKGVYAFVLVSISYEGLRRSKRSQTELAEHILKFPFVKTSRVVTGPIDMVLTVRADDIKDLNGIISTIQTIPGIKKTETLIVLNESQ